MEELFKKIYIKSEADLPKEEGDYFCNRSGFNSVQHLMTTLGKSYMREIRWYLQPLASHNGETDGMFMITKNGPEEIESTSQPDHIKGAEEISLDYGNPWPTKDVLTKLIWATEYLLHEKNYDGHGHEELQICVKRGKEILHKIEFSSLPAPVRSDDKIRLDHILSEFENDFGHNPTSTNKYRWQGINWVMEKYRDHFNWSK